MTQKHILVVEDDPYIAEQLCSLLAEKGFLHTHAETLAAARGALGTQAFDLVISDLSIPAGDGRFPDLSKGLDLINTLAWQKPDLPVIVISGSLGSREVVEDLKAMKNVVAKVWKPYDSEELVSEIRQALA